jgi:hypothetical protein
MNCTDARELFPALLDQRTPATAHLDARGHLASCPDCQREFAALTQTLAALDAMPTSPPSPRLRKNFYAMLEEEKNSAASVRAVAKREHRASLIRWLLFPAGIAAAIAVGFLAGQRSTAPVVAASGQQVAALEKKVTELSAKIEKTNLIAQTSLLASQAESPTNERLRDVLAAARSDHPDKKALAALIDALAFDPNTNVRLRALDALSDHADQSEVRAGVLTALTREQNPLVQLEMIDFVAAAHDREATAVLEKISQNEQIDRAVRDAASRALTQL